MKDYQPVAERILISSYHLHHFSYPVGPRSFLTFYARPFPAPLANHRTAVCQSGPISNRFTLSGKDSEAAEERSQLTAPSWLSLWVGGWVGVTGPGGGCPLGGQRANEEVRSGGRASQEGVGWGGAGRCGVACRVASRGGRQCNGLSPHPSLPAPAPPPTDRLQAAPGAAAAAAAAGCGLREPGLDAPPHPRTPGAVPSPGGAGGPHGGERWRHLPAPSTPQARGRDLR